MSAESRDRYTSVMARFSGVDYLLLDSQFSEQELLVRLRLGSLRTLWFMALVNRKMKGIIYMTTVEERSDG